MAQHGLPGKAWPEAGSSAALARVLAAIRHDGFLIRHLDNGVSDAAFPVPTGARHPAALGTFLPTFRFVGAHRDKVLAELCATAQAPDVFLHFRISGLICGMGEIGYSSLFLSPEFGPRQRLMFIVTDAPLEPDPIFPGGLCDRCMLCAKECPGRAISRTETFEYTICGKTYSRGMLDEFRCATVFQSSSPEYNPFGTPETDEVVTEIIENGTHAKARTTRPGFFSNGVDGHANRYWDGGLIHDWMAEKIPFVGAGVKNFNHPGTICGGRGCMRACMMHLEQQGKLKNRFALPFRRRPPWKLAPVPAAVSASPAGEDARCQK